jgi:hypothetical protein
MLALSQANQALCKGFDHGIRGVCIVRLTQTNNEHPATILDHVREEFVVLFSE